VRNCLRFCELIKSSASLEKEAIGSHELFDGTTFVHGQNLEASGIDGDEAIIALFGHKSAAAAAAAAWAKVGGPSSQTVEQAVQLSIHASTANLKEGIY